MLIPNQIQKFFETYQIPLSGIKNATENEIMFLYHQAEDLELMFGQMFLFAFCDIDQQQIQTNFDSWDELYGHYINFVRGFLQAQIN